jgi:hypothetical protein
MRKLNLLKAIVDFVCIMSFIAIPILLVFIGIVFISNEYLNIPIKMNGLEVNITDINSKILFLFLILSSLLLIYGLFLFRKVLRLFQQKRIFDFEVINGFKKIGFTLVISSLLSGIPDFILKIINGKATLEIGLSSFVMIFCLGLFFLVLSEVFTIAKNQKEENELTI